MDIHTTISNELFHHKSIAALIWLICAGRELELSYHDMELFISKDGSKDFVSIWNEKEEQHFKSVEDLFESAVIDNKKFYEIWPQVNLGILF